MKSRESAGSCGCSCLGVHSETESKENEIKKKSLVDVDNWQLKQF